MNYTYIIFTASFFIFGMQNAISAKLKNGEILIDNNFISNFLFRKIFGVGYILLAINIFYEFYWVYGLLIFILGFLFIPFIFLRIIGLFFSRHFIIKISTPYPNTILTYIFLSILMVIILCIKLFIN